MIDCMDMTDEVRQALAQQQPVVALESTIVTHGMPWPANVETARAVEAVVRSAGAVPATIAISGGRIKIGLTNDELHWLGQTRDVLKLSRADLAYALSTRRNGATTVAATMICAQLAGIKVFATGGVGGVHRGAETSLDISADLEELARTDVTVVCAGAKALLDLPKTLEYLETRGVPVICFGVDTFPAFWSRTSDLPAPIRLDTAGEVAAMVKMRHALRLGGGVLVANPVPVHDEIPWSQIKPAVDAALAEAERRGVKGKAVTPFLLEHILKLTQGQSLVANIALVKNNALLAAGISREMG